MAEKTLTLCIVHDSGRVLLGMKKRGFGADRWNGFGGKLEENETALRAAHRELEEESGIKAQDMKERGMIRFHFLDTGVVMNVFLFSVTKYSGEPVETEEMRPQWFNFDEIPFKDMWPDDRFWLPNFLKGKNVFGKIDFIGNDDIVHVELDFA